MYFFNLTLAQFLVVFGGVSAVSVALYLLDRSRRRQVVSTLRFWVAAQQPAMASRRRHIQQPWSLLLQLAGMALLLLAIAQLRIGSPSRAGRDHVIVLDTSSWMAARSGNRTLMDLAKERARRYVRSLPTRDRIMLIRADGLASPATAFEPDHHRVEDAIAASKPGATALHLEQALSFARHVQAQEGGRAGDITFVGAPRTAEHETAGESPLPRNLRVLLVADSIENAGLRKVAARRLASDPAVWDIYVSVRNYGQHERKVTVATDFGPPGEAGRFAAGSRVLNLASGADQEAVFQYRTEKAGVLGVHLTPADAFPRDDFASMELPAQATLRVTVYSDQPQLLEPVLSSPGVTTVYRKPSEYRPNDKGLVILDRFAPPRRPEQDAIWIDPPAEGSPIPVRQVVEQEPFQGWNEQHPASAGLRAADFKLEKASVFETLPSDGKIGEVKQGPVIVARPGPPNVVVIGFHPFLSGMRYELAAPLLFANLLRWAAPEIFRRTEITAASVGNVRQVLDEDSARKALKITAENGAAVPFTMRDRTLDFFSGVPGEVRVQAGDREFLYSLTLPELWDRKWEPPSTAPATLPRYTAMSDASSELWPWLAVAGAALLLAEWLLYARFRRGRRTGTRTTILQRLARRATAEAPR
jgi:hypothetical protein